MKQSTETVRLSEGASTHCVGTWDSPPDPEWVRATCPCCGAPVVSNAYYLGGRGYVLLWECWQSLGEAPTCDYRRVL